MPVKVPGNLPARLILEQENAYLKKIRLIEKAALRKAKQDKNMN